MHIWDRCEIRARFRYVNLKRKDHFRELRVGGSNMVMVHNEIGCGVNSSAVIQSGVQ